MLMSKASRLIVHPDEGNTPVIEVIKGAAWSCRGTKNSPAANRPLTCAACRGRQW